MTKIKFDVIKPWITRERETPSLRALLPLAAEWQRGSGSAGPFCLPRDGIATPQASR